MIQIMKRNFSKAEKPSEFKSFFRLRLKDRPLKLTSMIKETYKTNKTVRRIIFGAKYLFGNSSINAYLKYSFFISIFDVPRNISSWSIYNQNVFCREQEKGNDDI